MDISTAYQSMSCFKEMELSHQTCFNRLAETYGKILNEGFLNTKVSSINELFTLHDFDHHCQNIMYIISNFFFSNTYAYRNSNLDSKNLYILNIAILFHDIGMATTFDWNRERHSIQSAEYFRSEYDDTSSALYRQGLTLVPNDINAIEQIIIAHSDIKDGSVDHANNGLRNPKLSREMQGMPIPVPAKKLAGILRLADELDVTQSRLAHAEYEKQLKPISKESEGKSSYQHWQRLHYFRELKISEYDNTLLELVVDDDYLNKLARDDRDHANEEIIDILSSLNETINDIKEQAFSVYSTYAIPIQKVVQITYDELINTELTKEQKRQDYLKYLSSAKRSMIEEAVDTVSIIRNKAKRHFDKLVGSRGIVLDKSILPSLKLINKKNVDMNVKDNQRADIILYNALNNQRASELVILLLGESGIGKSCILLYLFSRLLKEELYLPIFIPMREIRPTFDNKSPILLYAYDFSLSCPNWKRDVDFIKEVISKTVKNNNVELVFLLDGYNEFMLNASKDQIEIVREEISWFEDIEKIRIIISSRSDHGGWEDALTFQVNRLDKTPVKDYLDSHEHTVGIYSKYIDNNHKLIELLRIPLFLCLFTKTYSSKDVNTIELEKIEKLSSILDYCTKHHIARLSTRKNNNTMATYAMDILLPFISLRKDIKAQSDNEYSNVVFSYDWNEFLDKAHDEAKNTLADEYSGLWTGTEYRRSEFRKLIEDDDIFTEELINNTILDNAVYMLRKDHSISWQHELLMDWFIAKGIILKLKYNRNFAIKYIYDVIDKTKDGGDDTDVYLPITLFLYEMLEDKNMYNNNPEYIDILIALARAYFNAKDSVNIYRFANLALDKIESGALNKRESWLRASDMNHVAYSLLSVKQEDMVSVDGFDLTNCIKRAIENIDKAWNIMQDSPNTSIDASLEEAMLYGNIGAYYLRMYDQQKDTALLHKALDYHNRGLSLKDSVFKNNPGHREKNRLLGQSYLCLATDYFQLGDYVESLINHRKALKYFNHEDVTEKMRLVESCTRCIGTINRLLGANNSDVANYFTEVLEVYHKALENKGCLHRNRKELSNIKSHCETTIQLMRNNIRTLSEKQISDIHDIAFEIDTICIEYMLNSDLKKQAEKL